MPDQLEMFKCCSHCKYGPVDCDRRDPGHSLACPESNCRTGKALL